MQHVPRPTKPPRLPIEFINAIRQGRGAGEEAGREGPEGGIGHQSSHRADDESDSRKNGIAKMGGSDQRQAHDD
jgi:hypothetical protein